MKKIQNFINDSFFCIGGIVLLELVAPFFGLMFFLFFLIFLIRLVFLKIKKDQGIKTDRNIIYLSAVVSPFILFFIGIATEKWWPLWLHNSGYLLFYIVPIAVLFVGILIGERKGIFEKSKIRIIFLALLLIFFMSGFIYKIVSSSLFPAKPAVNTKARGAYKDSAPGKTDFFVEEGTELGACGGVSIF